jgi:opacity protein-like surface antigen
MRLILLATCALLWVADSAAAQSFFVSGHFGGSPVDAEVSGENTSAPGGFDLEGSDSDQSVVGGGSLGFHFPTAWVLPEDFHFPRARWMRRSAHRAVDWTEDWFTRWRLGIELEAAAGRQFNFETDGFTNRLPYRTKAESTTLMANFSLAIPIYWGISARAGVGIGPAFNEVRTDDTIVEAKDTSTVFAWQWGGGIEYGFNEHIAMGLGYRHIDLGTSKASLENVNRDAGDIKVDLEADEFLMRLRVDFYSF